MGGQIASKQQAKQPEPEGKSYPRLIAIIVKNQRME